MKRSIDFLSFDQKQLLVLMSICKGPSIPKSALQFLYSIAISHENCNLLDFQILCNELEAEHLLAENDVELLSIHSLTKGFILDQMRESVKRVTTLLNEASVDVQREALIPTKASVTRVLADLFIDVKFRIGATSTGSDHQPSNPLMFKETQPDRATKQFKRCATTEFKRTASESIMELLVLKPRPSNEWTDEFGMCVTQVLLEFVDEDRLDQESISKLLGSSISALPILTFLKNVCLLEKFWEGNGIGCTSTIPQALLNLLRDNSCTELLNRAASVLADLCWSHKENSNAFANASGMLPQLALFLSEASSTDLQKYAAKVLAACAYWDYFCTGTVIPKIVAEAGLVDSLVDLLAKDENPSVQSAVGHALSNLAVAKSIVNEKAVSEHGNLNSCLREHKGTVLGSHKDVLAQWPGLLEVLVKALTKAENPVLQFHASSALANIAGTNENATLEKLLDHSGLVDSLVSTLYEDQNPQLQKQSAYAICKLATYRAASSIRHRILHWPGLMEGLAKSLPKSANPFLQVAAARAISHLTYQIKDTADGVVIYPWLLDNLVQLLDESQKSCAPAAAPAVSALCSLTDIGNDSLRARIVSSSPFLAKLTKSILTGEDRAFEADVVCLVANLAVTKETGILERIAQSPGLVDKLAQSLAEAQSSPLQVNAFRALLKLAGEENNKRFDISCYPELLQRLKKALLQSEHLVLRETVITALTSLRASKEKAAVDRGVNTHKSWALLDEFIKGLTANELCPSLVHFS